MHIRLASVIVGSIAAGIVVWVIMDLSLLYLKYSISYRCGLDGVLALLGSVIVGGVFGDLAARITLQSREEETQKKPRLAALLNTVPLGFGYIYLRRWKRFAATAVVGPLAVFAGIFFSVWYMFGNCFDASCSTASILAVLLSLPVLVVAFTALDAWYLAFEGDTNG